MKKSKKIMLLGSASLFSISSIIGMGMHLSNANLETNIIEDSILSNSQNNDINRSNIFQGAILTKEAVTQLGWDRKTTITQSDWSLAPNVTQIGPPSVVGGDGSASPFYRNTSLKSIYIPNRITDINFSTFNNVNTLEEVTFQENSKLNNIRGYAFRNTSIQSIEIPNSVTLMGEYIFESATKLQTITFQSNSKLNSIGVNAFQNTALISIDIPNSVTALGANAFTSTNKLLGSNVSIHNRLKGGTIPLYGFTSEQWVDIIWKDLVTGSILTKEAVATLGWDTKTRITLTDWKSAPNITQIGPNMSNNPDNAVFFNNNILEWIEIPSRIKIIGELSFWSANALKSITFEENSSLTLIGKFAFFFTALTSIEIPKSVLEIQATAFYFLQNLRSITFEKNSKLTTIGDFAFQQTGITSIDIPDSVTTIGNKIFYETFSLKGDKISMPASLKGNSLEPRYGLTQEQWDNILWRGLYQGLILTKQAVEQLGWNRKTRITLNDWQAAPNVVQLGDPSVTTGQGNEAPFSYNSIIQSIEIPKKVTSINFAAFYQASALKNVTFEQDSQLSIINGYSFRQSAIVSIKVPASVTTIGQWAFESTPSLKSIIFESGSMVKTIETKAFQGSGIIAINLPDSVTTIGSDAFKQTASLNGNQVFMSIRLQASSVQPLYGFSQNQWSTISWRTFQFTGTILTKAVITNLGWDTVTTITLEDWKNLAPNIIQIGSNDEGTEGGFANNSRLQSIFIPNSILSIRNFAFSNTTALRTITFENSSQLNLIGESAFQNSKINSIDIPNGVTTIGLNAFNGTSSLIGSQVFMSIDLKSSSSSALYGFSQPQWDTISWRVEKFNGRVLTKDIVRKLGWDSQRIITIDDWDKWAPNVKELGDSRSIDSAPFSNNLILQSIQIPARITQINSFSFYNTKSLTTITFDGVSELIVINSAAFKESGITSFEIQSGVVSIGQSAFEATSSLTTITFAPNSTLKSIENFAFVKSGITSINIPISVTTIRDNVFGQTNSLRGDRVRMSLQLKANYPASLYGFSEEQWNNIDWIRSQFKEKILTKEAVVALGWDFEKIITLDDWSKWAPNVNQLGTNEASGGPFLNNTILESIEIPDNIKVIGDFAFRGASSLTSIIFQNNSQLTSIGNQSFLLTDKLKTINLEFSSKLTSIGLGAFQQSGITSINIPVSVTTIGNNAFSQTNKLVGNQILMKIELKGNSVNPLYGFTSSQWNNIDWIRTKFIGQTLTKDIVLSLGWNTEEKITLDDWAKWAPEVIKIGLDGKVGDGPFTNNKIIKSIQIPEKITSISNNTFSGTSSLTDIQLSYKLFSGGNSSEAQFGLSQSQWNSINWTNIPKENVPINSIIARHLLKADSVITWDEISLYIGIQANAFSNTNITSIRIQWKEDFVIGDNAFFNTPLLTNIEISDKYQTWIPNYGFTQSQMKDLIIIDKSPADIATIVTATVLVVVMIALITTGGILFSKYTKNKNNLGHDEEQDYNYENEHYN